MCLRSFIAAIFVPVLASYSLAAPPLQEPWEESYVNQSATGPDILACWKFDDMPLADPTGRGMKLIPAGAVIQAQGRFGGGLTCRTSATAGRSSVLTSTSLPRLSPAGAFTAEMWVRPVNAAYAGAAAHLLDKQGATREDYRWGLLAVEENGLRRMVVSLGFGTFVKEFISQPFLLPLAEWSHLAFTYDGSGTVAFFVGQESAGSSSAERCGAVQAGALALSLGDGHHTYAGFPGDIDEVRLSQGVRGFAPFLLEVSGTRHVWQRFEKGTPLKVICTNLQPRPLTAAGLAYTMAGGTQSFILPDLAPGASYETEFGPDTALKPGEYQMEVVMSGGGRKLSRAVPLQIVPRASPALPVIVQGAHPVDLPHLRALACTHWTGLTNEDDPMIGPHGRHRAREMRPVLEAGLISGLRTVAALAPWRYAAARMDLPRLDREGKPCEPRELDTAHPSLASLYINSGQRFALAYREEMAWTGVWLNATPLSSSKPGFSTAEREAYRKYSSGRDIPPEIQHGGGVDWRALPGFPEDRVVPDDHPILQYYRWFWSRGNGWRDAHDGWCDGLEARRQERLDVWTVSEPAVSQPSIGGTSGRMNFLADHSTDARDPLLAGLCADQLLAMSAASARGQGAFGIVPMGWDREAVSPRQAAETAESIHLADLTSPALRVTLAPAILKETLWMMLSRPVKGLVITELPLLIRTSAVDQPTHPHAQTTFRDFADKVLRPLGPMLALRQTSRTPVVVLESFTAQIFAGRGLYRGASPRTLEVWRALQHAHIQAEIVYEDTLESGGLEGRSILIMPECDVLSAGLVRRLQQWQQEGGKILADDNLCPALKADAQLPQHGTLANAASPATTNVAPPATEVPQPATETSGISAPEPIQSLPGALASIYDELGGPPRLTCDHPDVVLHASRSGEATCLFVMNDRREAGTYVGQHGQVLESALPVSTSLNLGSESVNVYDLTRSAFLLPKRGDHGLSLPLKLGPAEGRILLISPSPLLEMNLDLPETATCGNVAEARISITTSGGRPMPAAIPVLVRVRDAEGVPAEWDGYHAVEDGSLTLRLELARNETPGAWEISVRELASGIEVVKWMQVKP